MSKKQIIMFRYKLKNVLKELQDIEKNESYYMNPVKKQIDLLQKKIEYKRIILEIAILEHKDKDFINSLKEEISLYSKRLISFENIYGYNIKRNKL